MIASSGLAKGKQWLYSGLSHKQSSVQEQEENVLHLWGVLGTSEFLSELFLVLQYQGSLVLRGREGSGAEGALLSSFLVCCEGIAVVESRSSGAECLGWVQFVRLRDLAEA